MDLLNKKINIDVVYVVYHNYEELHESLYSLKNFINKTNINMNIFIVDNSHNINNNFKKDNLFKVIKELTQSNFICNYYPSKYNLGFGKGCNYGANKGCSEIILFANCDTDFSPCSYDNFLNHLSLIVNNKDSVGITGPRILNNDDLTEQSFFSFDPFSILFKPINHIKKISKTYKTIYKFNFLKRFINLLNYEGLPTNRLVEIDWISGCCMFMSRKFFNVSNGFDERYFLYFDDVDICREARKNNFKVLFDPRLVVKHLAKRQSSSTKGLVKSLLLNKTSRLHISSWLLYLIKWRKDFLYKIFLSFPNIFSRFTSAKRKYFSVYELF